MAWQTNYTDSFNENYPISYWRVVQCNLDKEQQTGHIVLYGYETQAKAGGRIIGQHVYEVTPALYNAYFLPTLIQPAGIDHIKQCYALSAAVLDVDTGTQTVGNPDATPPVLPQEIFVSFFNGATDI